MDLARRFRRFADRPRVGAFQDDIDRIGIHARIAEKVA